LLAQGRDPHTCADPGRAKTPEGVRLRRPQPLHRRDRSTDP
jgi:hypothetical protein